MFVTPEGKEIFVVDGHTQSEPPLVAITSRSAAILRSTPSASGAPRRRRQHCTSVR